MQNKISHHASNHQLRDIYNDIACPRQALADREWKDKGCGIAGDDACHAIRLLSVSNSHPQFPIFATTLACLPSLANGQPPTYMCTSFVYMCIACLVCTAYCMTDVHCVDGSYVHAKPLTIATERYDNHTVERQRPDQLADVQHQLFADTDRVCTMHISLVMHSIVHVFHPISTQLHILSYIGRLAPGSRDS